MNRFSVGYQLVLNTVLNLANEARLAGRFALAGILNTAVGLSVIFGLTYLRVSPVLSNAAGYALGLTVGFISAKGYVFRSDGQITDEAKRYLGAFAFSYLVNLSILLFAIHAINFKPLLCQVIAISCHAGTMFLCSRLYVFRITDKNERDKLD